MKYRLGFVTNSSSSSFICLKVSRNFEKEILKQNNIDIDDIYDLWRNNGYENFDLKGGLICAVSEGEVSYVGFDLCGELWDKTVRQHESDFINTLKNEYNLEVTEKDVDFDYGEIYNG